MWFKLWTKFRRLRKESFTAKTMPGANGGDLAKNKVNVGMFL